jgi:hypothetical protein
VAELLGGVAHGAADDVAPLVGVVAQDVRALAGRVRVVLVRGLVLRLVVVEVAVFEEVFRRLREVGVALRVVRGGVVVVVNELAVGGRLVLPTLWTKVGTWGEGTGS